MATHKFEKVGKNKERCIYCDATRLVDGKYKGIITKAGRREPFCHSYKNPKGRFSFR